MLPVDVVETATLLVLTAESVFPVNSFSCSWIASKASTILAKASSNASSRDVRDSNSSAEQMTEGAAAIWADMTGMFGLEE